jgi:hypothetical protein
MEAAVAQLAIMALQTLIREAPGLFLKIQAVLSKPDVTPEEIEALKQEILGDTYEKLVPNSQLRGAPEVDDERDIRQD